MKGVVTETIKRMWAPAAIFTPFCAVACSLSSPGQHFTPAMLAALVLGAIWLLMLPEEINPAHIRVFRMLPVPRESRALELWTLFVGMPLALTVAGSALCHAVLALYGETPPEVQRTLLLVVWVGLLVKGWSIQRPRSRRDRRARNAFSW